MKAKRPRAVATDPRETGPLLPSEPRRHLNFKVQLPDATPRIGFHPLFHLGGRLPPGNPFPAGDQCHRGQSTGCKRRSHHVGRRERRARAPVVLGSFGGDRGSGGTVGELDLELRRRFGAHLNTSSNRWIHDVSSIKGSLIQPLAARRTPERFRYLSRNPRIFRSPSISFLIFRNPCPSSGKRTYSTGTPCFLASATISSDSALITLGSFAP